MIMGLTTPVWCVHIIVEALLKLEELKTSQHIKVIVNERYSYLMSINWAEGAVLESNTLHWLE